MLRKSRGPELCLRQSVRRLTSNPPAWGAVRVSAVFSRGSGVGAWCLHPLCLGCEQRRRFRLLFPGPLLELRVISWKPAHSPKFPEVGLCAGTAREGGRERQKRVLEKGLVLSRKNCTSANPGETGLSHECCSNYLKRFPWPFFFLYCFNF